MSRRPLSLVPEKIEAALKGRKAGSNLVADYPNPDLAIEIDISRPRADRQAIYAALGVTDCGSSTASGS